MAKSGCIGAEMPNDFPLAEHDRVNKRIGPYQPQQAALYTEYASGWNGIAYRFRSCADADDLFTASIKKNHAPPPEERLEQETALYTFFCMGYAVLENFAYAAHSIAAMLKPQAFPMNSAADLKRITIPTVVDRFSTNFSQAPLSKRLVALTLDDEFKKWGAARNMLTHRGTPPRAFSMKIIVGAEASPGETAWVNMNLAIDKTTTTGRRPWLAKTLDSCVKETVTFTEDNFAKK